MNVDHSGLSDLPRADRAFRRWFCFALGLTLGYMAWHYRGGENSYVITHDCLDVLVPEYTTFAKSGLLFASGDAIFPRELGGVPRKCLLSELYLPLWPYAVLDPFKAYVVNEVFLRLVALIGMALLLRRHVLPESSPWLVVGAALSFALLPFYPYALSIAGQPLLFYAVLNLAAGKRPLLNLVVVAIFPFFSSLVLVGFFLVPLLGVYTAYSWWHRRRLSGWLVAACILLAGGYVATNYRLFLNQLHNSGYVSHRVEFVPGAISTHEALTAARDNFLFGQYHAASCQFPVIWFAALLALATCAVKVAADDRIHWRGGLKGILGTQNYTRTMLTLIALFFVSAAASLIIGLQDWKETNRLLAAVHLKALTAFNYGRVHWLHPAVWGVIFALALEQIRLRVRSGCTLVAGLLVLQCVFAIRGASREQMTYHQFYSPELFAEIKDHIGKPQESYRVGSIGMHPAIALYNGFYNIDGYFYDYPLEYKHRLHKAIAGELAKDEQTREYFDDWGSRAYLFPGELKRDYFCTKQSKHRKIDELSFDTAALQDLGTAYILSALEIGNSDKLGWKLEKVFERDDSPWKIYLYSIPPAKDGKH